MSISRDKSDASDALLMTPTAGETESCTVTADMSEAQANFGKGTAHVQSVGSGWLIDLFFSPFEDGRPESLPVEACRAWGLLKHFEAEESPLPPSIPPSALTLRLGFERTASYQERRLGSAKLFFASDPLQRDASAAGCKVAQQLISIAKGFFALNSSVDTSLPPSLPPALRPSHPADGEATQDGGEVHRRHCAALVH